MTGAAGLPMITAWIDATRPAASWQLWGMSLVERQLRQLALRGAGSARVAVAGNGAPRIRADFGSRCDLDIQFHQVSGKAGFGVSLAGTESPLLLLEGDGVYDDRVLDHLLAAGPGNSVAGGGLCAAWADTGLVAELAGVPPGEGGVPGPALWKAVSEQTRVTGAARLDSYVPELRLTMAPVMVRLERPAQLREVERLMYRRTFKGVIDIVASRGYYHPVRWITRRLAPTEVSPNSVTALSIAAIWLAVPCFPLGMPGAGIALGWAGVIADSVDGKLARLTLNLSDRMGAVEHVSAVPALGLWLLGFRGLGERLETADRLGSRGRDLGAARLLRAGQGGQRRLPQAHRQGDLRLRTRRRPVPPFRRPPQHPPADDDGRSGRGRRRSRSRRDVGLDGGDASVSRAAGAPGCGRKDREEAGREGFRGVIPGCSYPIPGPVQERKVPSPPGPVMAARAGELSKPGIPVR